MKNLIKLILFPGAVCGCAIYTIFAVLAFLYAWTYESDEFKGIRFKKIIIDQWISIIPFMDAA